MMYRKIRIQSLKKTLLENNENIQRITQRIIVYSVLITLILFGVSYYIAPKKFIILFIPGVIYLVKEIYKIKYYWLTNKKINQKIKEIQ